MDAYYCPICGELIRYDDLRCRSCGDVSGCYDYSYQGIRTYKLRQIKAYGKVLVEPKEKVE